MMLGDKIEKGIQNAIPIGKESQNIGDIHASWLHEQHPQ